MHVLVVDEFVAETDLDAVVATLEAERTEVCVIDSVQTLHAGEASDIAQGASAPAA